MKKDDIDVDRVPYIAAQYRINYKKTHNSNKCNRHRKLPTLLPNSKFECLAQF